MYAATLAAHPHLRRHNLPASSPRPLALSRLTRACVDQVFLPGHCTSQPRPPNWSTTSSQLGASEFAAAVYCPIVHNVTRPRYAQLQPTANHNCKPDKPESDTREKHTQTERKRRLLQLAPTSRLLYSKFPQPVCKESDSEDLADTKCTTNKTSSAASLRSSLAQVGWLQRACWVRVFACVIFGRFCFCRGVEESSHEL